VPAQAPQSLEFFNPSSTLLSCLKSPRTRPEGKAARKSMLPREHDSLTLQYEKSKMVKNAATIDA
jgi:hypothetical protein